MTNRTCTKYGIGVVLLGLSMALTFWRATPSAFAGEPTTRKSSPADASFDALRALKGTWVSSQTMGKNPTPLSLVFRSTSMDSAVMETMFSGTDHEMVNMYTVDGDNLVLTHYCAMGNQPHMRLSSMDNGVLKFEFVSGGNMASRDEMHMDSLEITIKGDQLSEKWEMYQDGKAGHVETFEFKRQS